MAVGTPVLVNAQSEVLVDHCRKSNAGLYYADRWEFTEALKLLMKDSALRAAMGRNGKAYVAQNYRWSTILRKYDKLFAALADPSREVADRERPRDYRQPDRRPQDRDRDRDRDRFRNRGNDRNRGRARR
jgi:hypothetical protein